MTTQPAGAPGRRSLRSFLWECNPLYLLSAVCMLTGCWLIRTDLARREESWAEVLLLIGVFNAYELLVVGLGLFLVLRRGTFRAGWELLALEVVFLVDAGFLQQQLVTSHLGIGLAVNAAVLLLALGKLWVVFRVLGLRPPPGEWAFAAGSLGLLAGLPVVFEAVGAASPDLPAALMAGWWAAGALLCAFPSGLRGHCGQATGRMFRRGSRTFRFALALIPFASLLLHLLAMHWTFEVPCPAAAMTPLLLGSAVMFRRLTDGWAPAAVVRFGGWALPALAAAFSLDGAAVQMALPITGEIISPLRVALLAAGGLWLWSFRTGLGRQFGYAAGVAVMLAAAGHSPAAMWANSAGLARRLCPTTPLEWGVAAIGSAFVLLGAGALISLYSRGSVPPVPEEDGVGGEAG